MIELKFVWDNQGLDTIKSGSVNFSKDLDDAIYKSVILIRNTAIDKISHGSRGGRLYKRRSVIHRASAPGEFPKSDTGRLVSSIRTDYGYLESSVGSEVKYGAYLENKSPLQGGRPWLERSYELNKHNIEILVAGVLKKTFKL